MNLNYPMKRKIPRPVMLGAALLTSTFFTHLGVAQDLHPTAEEVKAPKKEYSPYIEDDYPNRALFGDTHLHTSWSTDAGMIGTTLGPDDAYRVAKGGEVTSSTGWKVKLNRPLDFLVVADHAENLGLADYIRRSDPLLLANPTGKKWHDMVKAGKGYDAFIEWTAHDAKFFKIKMPEDTKMALQDRAYTSPIWYTP